MDFEIALGAEKDKGFRNHALEILKGKYTGLVSYLSLIFHVIEIANGQKESITRDNIEMAIKWCKYLESHARKIYRVSEKSYSEGAKALLEMIDKDEIGREFSTSHTYRKRREFLTTKKDVEPVLSELCNYGWIRKVMNTTGKFSYEVHPNLILIILKNLNHRLPFSAQTAFAARMRE